MSYGTVTGVHQGMLFDDQQDLLNDADSPEEILGGIWEMQNRLRGRADGVCRGWGRRCRR